MGNGADNDIIIYRNPSATIVQEEELKRFEREVRRLIDDRPGVKLAIDLSNTYHLASRALGLLVAFRKDLMSTNGRIALFGIHPAIAKVIEVTRLNTLIPVCDDERGAIEALRSNAPPG